MHRPSSRAVRSLAALAASALALGVVAVAPASATTEAAGSLGWSQAKTIAELTPPGGVPFDGYGRAVAVSANGKVAVVGAFGRSGLTGEAYVYSGGPGKWKLVDQLQATDGSSGGQFGGSVAISKNGKTIVVGATGARSNLGAAYVFRGSQRVWTQAAQLIPSDGAISSLFGTSVAVSASGGTVLVGAPRQSAGVGELGAAYVYSDASGSFQQVTALGLPSGVQSDEFGNAVGLSGDGRTAAVGSPGRGGKGSTFVFDDSAGSWQQRAELTAPGGVAGDQFGGDLAISASGTVIAATANARQSLTGTTYVFTGAGSTWSAPVEVTASNRAPGDRFGTSVSLSKKGTTMAVGAMGRASGAGAEYVFTLDQGAWAQRQALTASDAAPGNLYGIASSLSADGRVLFIGAQGNKNYTGAAYVVRGSRK